jgi:hypothetical protein
MVVKKSSKPRKVSAGKSAPLKTWRDAVRLHLGKVPEVDAVFACTVNGTVHVYSVVYDFLDDSFYKPLQRQERLIEKSFPAVSFEFHTGVHQGREPHFAAPWDAELVFSR